MRRGESSRAIPTMLAIITIAFFMIRAAPGNRVVGRQEAASRSGGQPQGEHGIGISRSMSSTSTISAKSLRAISGRLEENKETHA